VLRQRSRLPRSYLKGFWIDYRFAGGKSGNYLTSIGVQDSASLIAGMASKDMGQTVGIVSAMDAGAAGQAINLIYDNQETKGGMDLTTQILANPDMRLDDAHDILSNMDPADSKAILDNIGKEYPAFAAEYGAYPSIYSSHSDMITTGIVESVDFQGNGQYTALKNNNYHPTETTDAAGSKQADAAGTDTPVSIGSSGAIKDMVDWSQAWHLPDGRVAVDIDGNGRFDTYKSQDGTVTYRALAFNSDYADELKVVDNVLCRA
jgi:hypothetical protein